MKIAKIDVTLDDIAHGERSECSRCPIALAIKRECDDAIALDVGAEEVDITYACRTRARGLLPPEAQKFVEAFDGGNPVSPFSFEITFF